MLYFVGLCCRHIAIKCCIHIEIDIEIDIDSVSMWLTVKLLYLKHCDVFLYNNRTSFTYFFVTKKPLNLTFKATLVFGMNLWNLQCLEI